MSSIDLNRMQNIDKASNKTLPINEMMHFACSRRLHVKTVLMLLYTCFANIILY
jgi:hypothetical protein